MPAYLVLNAGEHSKDELLTGNPIYLVAVVRVVAADETAAAAKMATDQNQGGRFVVVPMSQVTIARVPEIKNFDPPVIE